MAPKLSGLILLPDFFFFKCPNFVGWCWLKKSNVSLWCKFFTLPISGAGRLLPRWNETGLRERVSLCSKPNAWFRGWSLCFAREAQVRADMCNYWENQMHFCCTLWMLWNTWKCVELYSKASKEKFHQVWEEMWILKFEINSLITLWCTVFLKLFKTNLHNCLISYC